MTDLHPAAGSASVPSHPLVYASLEPRHLSRHVKRMDLHKPQTTYSVGRGPLNDFVLTDEQSGQIGESYLDGTVTATYTTNVVSDWLHCTLSLVNDSVRILDNHTTNGIWVR